MKKRNRFLSLRCGLAAVWGLAVFQMAISADTMTASPVTATGSSEDREINKKILVEVFLASERKNDAAAIQKEFETYSVTRIRFQFFKLGNPPENIAIGSNVTADVARLAIRLAVTYNRGIKYLLPQFRFFPHYIAIGTSAFDESFQIPIRLEDLKQLSDPALTTPQFHELYRRLTGEDKRPF